LKFFPGAGTPAAICYLHEHRIALRMPPPAGSTPTEPDERANLPGSPKYRKHHKICRAHLAVTTFPKQNDENASRITDVETTF